MSAAAAARISPPGRRAAAGRPSRRPTAPRRQPASGNFPRDARSFSPAWVGRPAQPPGPRGDPRPDPERDPPRGGALAKGPGPPRGGELLVDLGQESHRALLPPEP